MADGDWIAQGPPQDLKPGESVEGAWTPVGKPVPLQPGESLEGAVSGVPALTRPHQDPNAHPLENTQGLFARGANMLFGHEPEDAQDPDQSHVPGIAPAIGAGVSDALKTSRDFWNNRVLAPGPDTSVLAKAIPHLVGADVSRLKAGYQDTVGALQYQGAQRTLAGLNVLPQVAARVFNGKVPNFDTMAGVDVDSKIQEIADDPAVAKQARKLGISPEEFAGDFKRYQGMSNEHQADAMAQAQDQLERGQANKTSADAARHEAWATERTWTPKMDPWSAKSMAFQAVMGAPELAGITAGALAGGAMGGPVGAVAGGAAASVALLAPQQREAIGDKIDDKVVELNERARAMDDAAPVGSKRALNPAAEQLRQQAADLIASSDHIKNTAGFLYAVSDVAGALPVADVLARAPGGSAVMNRIVGSALAKTMTGKAVGTMVANGAGMAVQTAIQKAVDVGIIHENTTLSDALKDITYAFVSGALTAAPFGAAHALLGAKAPHNTEAPEFMDRVKAATDDYSFSMPRADISGPTAAAGATNAPQAETKGPSGATGAAAGATNAPQAETPAPGAANARDAYQGKVETLKTAAAAAEKRSDVTLEPEEEGWSVHVKGQPVAQFDTIEAARQAMAQARKVVGTKPASQTDAFATPPPGTPPAADATVAPSGATTATEVPKQEVTPPAAETSPQRTDTGTPAPVSPPVKTPVSPGVEPRQPETELERTQPVQSERRTRLDTRMRVDQMTSEQKSAALLQDHKTPLLSERGWDEREARPTVVHLDLDSLKALNDKASYDTGDLILKGAGKVLAEEFGPNHAARVGGDEFKADHESPDAAHATMDKVNQRLAGTTIEVTLPDGRKVNIKGIGLSYGVGASDHEAETNLHAHKAAREAAGTRSPRGELPKGTTITAPETGRPSDQGVGAAQEVAKPPTMAEKRAANAKAIAQGLGGMGASGTPVLQAGQKHVVLGQEIERPHQPTPAQSEAGNYKKPEVAWQGHTIKVENVPGDLRHGVDHAGIPFERTMHAPYGYFPGTKSTDGEGVDVNMGPHPEAKDAYVIDQVINGKYDEPKVVVGVKSEPQAKQTYLLQYQPGWQGLGAITKMSPPKFEHWLHHEDHSLPVAWKPPPPGKALTPVSAVTPAAAPAIPKGQKLLGQNAEGEPVLEDERGIRSVLSDGHRIEETVGLTPTRTPAGGVKYEPSRAHPDEPRFQVAGPAAAAQTQTRGDANLPAERLPTSGAERPQELAAAGARDREPLDAGLAERGEGAPQERRVPEAAEGAGGARAGDLLAAGESAPGAPRDRGAVRPVTEAAGAGADHDLSEADLGRGGLKSKYRDNLAAIKILKALDTEGRVATPEERAELAHYVGWGAMKGVFDPQNKQWAKQHGELKALLSDAEYKAARASTLNAHYTSKAVVRGIFAALQELGFEHGRILEPALGTGNFFGLMPQSMRQASELHGVELDPLTAKIAKGLYPSANIVQGGFQDYQVPAEYFDAVIGNPPFGNEPIVDTARSAYSGAQIHNYFLAKSIDKLRPGGLMAVVVSHYFLDSGNAKTREWIAEHANLVGAARLPNTAFKDNAGTEVVTDIVVFQKRGVGTKSNAADWIGTTEQKNRDPKTDEVHAHTVNKYMVEHPASVLGEPSAAGTMYSKGEYTVTPTGDLEQQLADWAGSLAKSPGPIYQRIERSAAELSRPDVVIPDGIKVGSYFVDPKGEVQIRGPDELGKQTAAPWQHPNLMALKRVKGMIKFRDVLRAQMRMEMGGTTPEKDLERNRKKLNATYDQFKAKFGMLNTPANRRLFLDDTEAPLVLAQEFDYDRGIGAAQAEREGIEPRPPSARKADIFDRRVLFPPEDNVEVHSAKDALLASLNYKGTVDPAFMASVYEKTPAEIEKELGDVLYRDPQKGLVSADEYLSGDVKTKLAEARAAAETNPAMRKNVAALERVIPQDKLPSQIHASLGAAFVPEDVFADFYKHITGAPHEMKYVPALAQWFSSTKGAFDQARNGDLYGTKDIKAKDILDKTMAGQAVLITKTVRNGDGSTSTIVMQNETELARAKQEAIKDEWRKWLWGDAARADKVAGLYNEKLNRIVNRQFDGLHLTFPGMSPAIKLLDHQKNAVWRGLQTRQMLLDHVVGAGKTYAMATLAMEMRRLGISRKPMLAVPNHLTGQWRSEFSKLYPSSYILVAEPEDFQKANRQKFFSKIATGDWDAVIVGHSSLKKIGLPAATEAKIIKEQMERLSESIEEMKRSRGDRNIIRDMENIKARLEAKFQKKVNALGERDKVVSFDELGLDSLMVDELHEFKNLFYTSTMARAAGMGNPTGSDKAFDLFVKLRWLTDTFGEKAPIVGATGTPVSNSLVEMYNMQRFLQFPTLQRMGLDVFDSWAKQFGNMESVYEVAPSGTGWRNSTRFQKFANLPALMSLYKSFADTVTLDNLKAQEQALGRTFPIPKLESGGPINVVAERSKLQEAFMGTPRLQLEADGLPSFDLNVRPSLPEGITRLAIVKDEKTGKYEARGTARDDNRDYSLGAGYETPEDAQAAMVQKALTPKLAVDPNSILGKFEHLRELMKKTNGKVNALSITGAANKAGLDYRLIDPNAPDHPGSKINRAVENILAVHKLWEKDKGTQLVFCDLSVPLSARMGAASTPRLAYVRDPSSGELTHKRATLHTVAGHEGMPYFAAERGAKAEKRIDVYDAASGVLVNRDLLTKAEAHQWAKKTLDDEEARTRWHLARSEAGELDQDAIDDYNNAHEIDPEETPSFGRDDIAGASGSVKFSVYDDIKAKLLKGGIPAHEVQFIHDFNTPAAKQKLFDRVNAGDVRVLLGSTTKMGAGTNVQQRIVGLHHIDAPWRPSDLEQRDGRAIRRGNKLYDRDPEGFRLRIYRYATAQTYDTRRWQVLEHKARGIEQLRNYNSSIEQIDDIEGQAADAADMKAAASGDPLILEETRLRNEVQGLERLAAATADQQAAMRAKARSATHTATKFLPGEIAKIKDEMRVVERYPKDKDGWAPVELDGEPFKNLKAFEKEANAAIAALRDESTTSTVRLKYRGLSFALQPQKSYDQSVLIHLKGPESGLSTYYGRDPFSASGLLTRLSNYVEALPGKVDWHEAQIKEALQTAKDSEAASHRGFEKQAELESARERYKRVKAMLLAKGPPVAAEELPLLHRGVLAQREALDALDLGNALREIDAQTKKPVSFADGTHGWEGVEAGTDQTRPTANAVRDALAPIVRKLSVQPQFQVHATFADVLKDPYLKGRMAASLGHREVATAWHDPNTGVLHFVADQLVSLEHAKGVLAHELVHYGLKAMLGARELPKYQALLDGIVKAMPAEVRRKGKSYFPGSFDMGDRTQRGIAAEEALAGYAERDRRGETLPGRIRRLVDKFHALIRDWLRKVMGLPKKYDELFVKRTLADLEAFLRKGRPDAASARAEGPAFAGKEDTFFSALARAVDASPRGRGTGAEWLATLKAARVKDQELEWTGLKDWLNGRGRVSKDEVAAYVHAHQIQLEERLLGMGEAGNLGPLREWMEENRDPDAGIDDLAREREILDAVAGGDTDAIGGLEQLGVPAEFLEPLYNTQNANGDVVEGAPRYASYVSPGGKNYRELLLTLPGKAPPPATKSYSMMTAEERQAHLAANAGIFHSAHWGTANVLAHVRYDERTGPNGERVLHVHEIQSDWHQQGRKYGYQGDATDLARKAKMEALGAQQRQAREETTEALMRTGAKREDAEAMLRNDAGMRDWKQYCTGWPADALEAATRYHDAYNQLRWMRDGERQQQVANAPFKTTWHELAMKRMLRMAAEKGFDALSWDTGKTNADRYSLAQQVDHITVAHPDGADSKFHLRAYRGEGKLADQYGLDAHQLAETIGKEMAQRAAENAAAGQLVSDFKGPDLEVGGAGMRGFYDKMLPTAVGKLVKKWGAKVEPAQIGEAPYTDIKTADERHPIPAHMVRITPAMRDSVMGGQPMFLKRRKGSTGAAAPAPKKRGGALNLARRAVAALPKTELNQSLRRIVDPAGVSDFSAAAALRLRESLGGLAQAREEAIQTLQPFVRAFEQLSTQDRYDFIDDMEEGRKQRNPELQPAADVIRKLFDDWRDRIRSLGVGALENFIQDYFPHIWRDPKETRAWIAKVMGRRPLLGPKSFLKERTIPTTKEGLAAGLTPISTNPLVLTFAKLAEMQKFYHGVEFVHAIKDERLAVFKPSFKRMPDGWAKIEDAVGRVLQWSEAEQGFIERGHYIMPEDAARVVNNHLSSSALANFLPAQLLRVGSNAVNALQLGFSGFHLGFTTLDAIVSKNALGIERLFHGEPLKAAAAFLEAGMGPIGAAMNLRRGHQLRQAYQNPAAATPGMQRIVEGLKASGGQIKMDKYFQAAQGLSPFQGVGFVTLAQDIKAALTQPSGKVWAAVKALGSFPLEYATKHWRDLEDMAKTMPLPALTVPLEVAGRVTRASTAIIMEHIVPLQKLGVFSDLAADHIRRNPGEDSVAFAGAMQRIWDSVDNRLGEMVYNNLFWNRTFKDVSHLSVRAVGWNLGTVRELGGAPIDVVKLLDYIARGAPAELEAPPLTKTAQARLDYEKAKSTLQRVAEKAGHKIAYTLALVGTTAIAGAILQYLFTGEGPQEIKDYFFPWTGRMTKYGTKERISLPSYMKDIYEYATQPGTTLINKANPIFGIIGAIYKNEDFFGNGIRDTKYGFWRQALEGAQYAAHEVLPFSVQGTKEFLGAGPKNATGRTLAALPYFGLTPAPARVTSPEQMDRYQQRESEKKYIRGLQYKLKQALAAGDAAEAGALRDDIQQHKLTERGTERQIREDKIKGAEAQRSQEAADKAAEKISGLIQGKSREAAAQALEQGGLPAFAALWRSLPEAPRPRIAQALEAFA